MIAKAAHAMSHLRRGRAFDAALTVIPK